MNQNLQYYSFRSFISATFLGFAPGSFAFVYMGSAGKVTYTLYTLAYTNDANVIYMFVYVLQALFGEGASTSIPWYGYAAVGAFIIFCARTIGKIASDAVNTMEIDGDSNNSDGGGKIENVRAKSLSAGHGNRKDSQNHDASSMPRKRQ